MPRAAHAARLPFSHIPHKVIPLAKPCRNNRLLLFNCKPPSLTSPTTRPRFRTLQQRALYRCKQRGHAIRLTRHFLYTLTNQKSVWEVVSKALKPQINVTDLRMPRSNYDQMEDAEDGCDAKNVCLQGNGTLAPIV